MHSFSSRMPSTVWSTRHSPRKGKEEPPGGTQQMFIRGVSAPRSSPLPFYVPFFTKKAPLSRTFSWQMVPLSHALFRFCILFNCCKCSVFLIFFLIGIDHKNRTFSRLYKAIKFICVVSPFGPLLRPNDKFPYNKSNRYPFIYLKPKKDTPFGRSLPV